MPPAFSSLAHRGIPDVCTTPNCAQIAESIMSYVNLNVDPCSDFFQYTCGSWLSSDEVKEKVGRYLVPMEIQATNLDYITNFLEGTFEDLYETIKTIDPSYHTQDKIDIDRKSFQLIKEYYDTCKDTESNRILGATPLFPYLAQIENILLPLTEYIVPGNLAKVMAASTLREVETVLSIVTYQNNADNTYNIVYALPPSVDTSADYENVDSLEDYRKYIIEMLIATVGDASETTDYYGQFVLQASQKNNFVLWSSAKIESAASRFVDFEMKLSKVAKLMNPLDYESIIPFTLKELESINPTIDWNMFVTTLVSAEYYSPDLPIVFQKECVEMIEKILSTTSVETLQEYFVIQTIKQTADKIVFPIDVDPHLETKSFGFISQVNDLFKAPTGKEPLPSSRRQICAKDTGLKFGNIVGRFFSLKTLGATEELKKVEEMVNTIHSTWLHDLLPTTSWVDRETKAKIIQKIEALMTKVGVRTMAPDWRDPSSLEAYYDDVTISNNTSYYDDALSATVWKNNKSWKLLEQKRLKNEWFEELNIPEIVNAAYSPVTNTLQILIGIIQKPMYSTEYPEYLNYGALGSVIGHELVHSLDNQGKNYNATGYKVDWFSEAATVAYEEKSQCFIDQFNKFNLTGLYDAQFPLNGTSELGENIADSGGLSIAFHAYQNYIRKQEPEQLLPGFEYFTAEQLFFISHGIGICEIASKSKAQVAAEEVHAPFYYRNIGTFQNSAEFAKAFNCPIGSPMNPSQKCSIW